METKPVKLMTVGKASIVSQSKFRHFLLTMIGLLSARLNNGDAGGGQRLTCRRPFCFEALFQFVWTYEK